MDEKNINENCEQCGCGHDHEHEEMQTVKITFDNENEVECVVLGLFDVEEKEYIALLPVGEEDVLIYNYSDESGDVRLDQIKSDEEYEKVSAAFYEFMEEEMEENDDI